MRILEEALTLTVVTASAVVAQSSNTENTLRLDPDGVQPAATIEDMAWLAGYWQTEAFGGQVEDVWTAPSAGTMMGMFKVFAGETPNFYELQLIVEREGSLVWLVKHFSADFAGWEERDAYVSFPLVRLTDDTAYFSGLTVRRVSADELRVFLSMKGEGGSTEVPMTYRRATPWRLEEEDG